MHTSHLRISHPVRILMVAGWGLICLFVIAPPLLASHSCPMTASVLYFLFSRICHQISERSFHLLGYSLAVCHRCFGIYVGLLLGCFAEFPMMHRSTHHRRVWILGAMAPLALDALAPLAGLWTSSAFSRFSTGLFFGTLISSLVVRGFAEFVREAPWRRHAGPSPQLKGDIV